jgi:ketosteroid isomerase-like protein
MSLNDNKVLVTKFLNHFTERNIPAVLGMMAEDATWWIGGKPASFSLAGTKTKKEIEVVFNTIIGSMPNGVEMRIRSMIAEGDRVAAEVESYGPTASGRIYNNDYHFLFRLRGKEIVEVKEYLDTLHVVEVFQDNAPTS